MGDRCLVRVYGETTSGGRVRVRIEYPDGACLTEVVLRPEEAGRVGEALQTAAQVAQANGRRSATEEGT